MVVLSPHKYGQSLSQRPQGGNQGWRAVSWCNLLASRGAPPAAALGHRFLLQNEGRMSECVRNVFGECLVCNGCTVLLLCRGVKDFTVATCSHGGCHLLA